VAALGEAGVGIFILEEDIDRYGLRDCARLSQATAVSSAHLSDLLSRYQSIWHW
jgi:hypothetical protein